MAAREKSVVIQTATPMRVCAQCGADAPMRCQLCYERQLASPAYYCGAACQKLHWPTHRKFHKEAKDWSQLLARDADPKIQADLEVFKAAAAADVLTECQMLNALAVKMAHAGNFAKAAKLCRKAIKLDPKGPSAYGNLGDVLEASSDHRGAAQAFLQAKERHEQCNELGSEWAQASTAAIQYLLVPAFGVPKPAWWNDDELLALTGRVVELLPDNIAVYVARAEVLRGGTGQWEAAPRSAEQLREVCRIYKRAAALSDDPQDKEFLLERARDCIRQSLGVQQ